ncbi:hypothetical protein ABZ297_37890 [Nonomuraea sp. NPDC005983]|uniref:hypothetical protein n=1 Tax=Nonomuraea sp. NPDC005983 TaxID=3155595 RepID=UPI0033A2BDEA
MSGLNKEVQRAVKAAVHPLGFSATRTRGIFIQKRGEGAFGWLGLNDNDTDMPRSLNINPVVGAGHERVLQVLAELDPDNGEYAPVISQNLGYTMPEPTYRTWRFFRDGGVDATAEDLAANLTAYGEPFIAQWADWGRFSTEIETTDLLHEYTRCVVIPVVRVLNGRLKDAFEMVEAELARVAESQDVYAMFYRDEYAVRFRARKW